MSAADPNFEKLVKQEITRLEALHPTPEDIPGCMSVLDDFLSCNVMNSQMKSLYRFGQLASCKPKLEEFKFCMSVKSLHPEVKREVWIKRRAKWWATRRLGRSSEDVWDVREEPLKNFPIPRSELAAMSQDSRSAIS